MEKELKYVEFRLMFLDELGERKHLEGIRELLYTSMTSLAKSREQIPNAH